MAEPPAVPPRTPARTPAAARTPEAEPVTVREYGTRHLRITVRHHGGTRFSWLRVPG